MTARTAILARAVATAIVLQAGVPAVLAAEPAVSGSGAATGVRRAPPSWGAIASGMGAYGYAFNHRSQAAAEQAARAQCERPPVAGRGAAAVAPSACEVRTAFDRACAALVTGNFGEWGTAVAPTKEAAGRAAIAECNSHLPTEPCKLVIGVCSPG